MGVESPFTGKFIDELEPAWPIGAEDPKSEGDDHIRGIKQVLQNTFPQLSGAVTADETELNYLDTVTPGTAVASKALVVDANLDIDLGAGDLSATLVNGITTTELGMLSGRTLTSTDDKIDNFPATTKAIFWQNSAPTGWVKDTTTSAMDGACIRMETGTGGGTGGTHNVESAPAHTHTGTASGTTGGKAITIANMPSHTHSYSYVRGDQASGAVEMRPSDGFVHGVFVGATTGGSGSGTTHNHSFSDGFTTSGASATFRPKYINCITATKS